MLKGWIPGETSHHRPLRRHKKPYVCWWDVDVL
jgi:hypothetical protein